MMMQSLAATLRSLSAIMVEETAALEQGERPADIAPLVAAKLRLIGVLEASSAELERVEPGWLHGLKRDERQSLLAAVAAVQQAAAANAAVLVRQIDLSQELMEEIAGEARRLGGKRQQTYRRSGALRQRDGSAPVAVNTRY